MNSYVTLFFKYNMANISSIKKLINVNTKQNDNKELTVIILQQLAAPW